MDLTALLLSRIQFGSTVAFHIIFPSFTIGLAAWLTVLEEFIAERELHLFERRGFKGDEGRAVKAYWRQPASAFKRVRDFTRVVLLGPSHYAWLEGVALPDAQSFATPLGEVPIEAPPGRLTVRASTAVHRAQARAD